MFAAGGDVHHSKIPFIEDDEEYLSNQCRVDFPVDTLSVEDPCYNNVNDTNCSPPPHHGLIVHSEFGLKIFEVRSIADENIFSGDDRDDSSALKFSSAADVRSTLSKYRKDDDIGFEVNSSGILQETRNRGHSSAVTDCSVEITESAISVACPNIEDAANNSDPVDDASNEAPSVRGLNNSRLEHSSVVLTTLERSKFSSSNNISRLTHEMMPKSGRLCISNNSGIEHNYFMSTDLASFKSTSSNSSNSSSLADEKQSSKINSRPGRSCIPNNSRTECVKVVSQDLKSSKSTSSISRNSSYEKQSRSHKISERSCANNNSGIELNIMPVDLKSNKSSSSNASSSPSHQSNSSGIKLRSGRCSFSFAVPNSSEKKRKNIQKYLLLSNHAVIDSQFGHTKTILQACSVCQETNCKCTDSQKAYYCCLCNETFESQFMFNVDKKFHSAEKMHRQRSSALPSSESLKPFICKVCQQAFPAEYHLLAHKVVCCDITGAKSAARVKLSNLADKKYKCRMCQQEFSSEFFLAIHLNTHLLEITIYGISSSTCTETNPPLPLDSPSFGVQDCARQNASAHINEISHDSESLIYPEPNNKIFPKSHASSIPNYGKSKVFTCRSCSMVFSNKAILYKHQMNECSTYKLKCKFCQKRFLKRPHLLKHYQNKCNQPLKCDICSKSFIHRMNLLKHKEQSCSNNQSSMNNKNHVPSRSRVNLLEKLPWKKALQSRAPQSVVGPIQCRYCSKRFKTRRLLSTHKLINCQGKPFRCKTCHASFALVSKLYLHKKTCSVN